VRALVPVAPEPTLLVTARDEHLNNY